MTVEIPETVWPLGVPPPAPPTKSQTLPPPLPPQARAIPQPHSRRFRPKDKGLGNLSPYCLGAAQCGLEAVVPAPGRRALGGVVGTAAPIVERVEHRGEGDGDETPGALENGLEDIGDARIAVGGSLHLRGSAVERPAAAAANDRAPASTAASTDALTEVGERADGLLGGTRAAGGRNGGSHWRVNVLDTLVAEGGAHPDGFAAVNALAATTSSSASSSAAAATSASATFASSTATTSATTSATATGSQPLDDHRHRTGALGRQRP